MTKSSEFEALKARLKAMWMAGDAEEIAKHSEVAAQEFIRRRGIKPGVQVLDIACGSGNLAIPAAKAGAIVTGIDISPNFLAEARERAAREALSIAFHAGGAEELPYQKGSFDLVVSMFGAMFAPRPDRVADELLRVCRPGGQIAMANWTPTGFIGQVFKVTGQHVSPPAEKALTSLMGRSCDSSPEVWRACERTANDAGHRPAPLSVSGPGDGRVLPHLLWSNTEGVRCLARSQAAAAAP